MHAKFARFMPYPGDNAFEGLLSTSEQLNDQSIIDLFSDDAPPSEPAPADPPAGEPATPAAPAETPPAPAEQAPATPPQAPQEPEGGVTPPPTPATPQEPAQPAPPAPGEVVDPSDPRPEFPEIEVPEFETREEWQAWARTQEERRRNLQGWTDRQVAKASQGSQAAQQQLEQMQHQFVAMQQQMGALTQHALQPQQPQQQITTEDISEAVRTRPDYTIEWLRQNVPEAVDFALASVLEQHGAVEHSRLMRQVMQAGINEERQAQQQQVEAERAPEIVRRGFQQVLGSVRTEIGAAEFDAVSERVATLCVENMNELRDPQRHPNGVTPEAVKSYVMKQYVAAERERIHRAAAQPQQPYQLPAGHAVPTGSAGAGATPLVPANEGDALVDDMVEFQQSRQISI